VQQNALRAGQPIEPVSRPLGNRSAQRFGSRNQARPPDVMAFPAAVLATADHGSNAAWLNTSFRKHEAMLYSQWVSHQLSTNIWQQIFIHAR